MNTAVLVGKFFQTFFTPTVSFFRGRNTMKLSSTQHNLEKHNEHQRQTQRYQMDQREHRQQ